MAELVDAPASGAGAGNGVEVRVLFRAPDLLASSAGRQHPLPWLPRISSGGRSALRTLWVRWRLRSLLRTSSGGGRFLVSLKRRAATSVALATSHKLGRPVGLANPLGSGRCVLVMSGRCALLRAHTAFGRLRVIVWALVYSSNPCSPPSTPIPESLCPPNGTSGDMWRVSLIHTMPLSMRRAMA